METLPISWMELGKVQRTVLLLLSQVVLELTSPLLRCTRFSPMLSMATPHVTGVAALFLGSGASYNSVNDLYDDLIHHSTQGIITGLKANDHKTTRNLLYNKLEDSIEPSMVKPQDGSGDDDGADETKVETPKTKDDKGGRHHHHQK
jgi:hypothetical protein